MTYNVFGGMLNLAQLRLDYFLHLCSIEDNYYERHFCIICCCYW